MNENKETWLKWTYVCPDCDSYVEYTIKQGYRTIEDNFYCVCGGISTLLSVVDATIYPITEKKEEQTMETNIPTPAQTMTLSWIENDETVEKTYTENDVRAMAYREKTHLAKMNNYFLKESQLRTLLTDVYADSLDQETLAQVAEIFDVPLTKEMDITIYVRIDATVEVDLTQDMDALDDFVQENISIDAYSGELNVTGFEVTQVEEGAY